MSNNPTKDDAGTSGAPAIVANIVFATTLAAWMAWYCLNAWHANRDIENMILIFPASLVGLFLYICVVAGSFRNKSAAPVKQQREQDVAKPNKQPIRVVGSMVLLFALAIGGNYIGFDVATYLFVLTMLIFLGERRPLTLILFPLIFSAVVIYCFGVLLSTPLPVLLLRGQN